MAPSPRFATQRKAGGVSGRAHAHSLQRQRNLMRLAAAKHDSAKHGSLFQRGLRRLLLARPDKRELLLGGPAWALLMAASALLALYRLNGAQTHHLTAILLLYALGGLLAWPPALLLARFSTLHAGPETRFAGIFLCLTVGTIGMTALLFALQHRTFFAQWHAPAGSLKWMFQFVFTVLSAIYQFVVIGVRLFLPLGLAGLIAASLWLARKDRHLRR